MSEQLPEVQSSTEVGAILHAAVEKGVDTDVLEKLVALHERVENRRAEHEFNAAMAEFQSECPPITKKSQAKITKKSGGEYRYRYAELDEIAKTIGPYLHKRGLAYSWDSEMVSPGVLSCVCIVRHANGHSVKASFACPIDSSAAMSGPQKSASALTFARRQSLIQALGLTTADEDDDAPREEMMSDGEVQQIEDMITATEADRAKFYKWIGSESPAQWPKSKFRTAMNLLVKRGAK